MANERFRELDKLLSETISSSVNVAEDLHDEDDGTGRYQSEIAAIESGVIELITMCNEVHLLQQSASAISTSDCTIEDPVDLSEKFMSAFESAQAVSSQTFDPKTHPKYMEFKKYLSEGDDVESMLQDSGDGDLVVDRVQISLYCPITKKLLEKAVTSKLCHHSYSHEAILEHIRKRATPKCPVCNGLIAERDLTPNRGLRKMVKKEKKELMSRRINNAGTSDVVRL